MGSHFIDVLRELRAEMKFALIGWVLMAKHSHVLLRDGPFCTLATRHLQLTTLF